MNAWDEKLERESVGLSEAHLIAVSRILVSLLREMVSRGLIDEETVQDFVHQGVEDGYFFAIPKTEDD